MLNSLGCNVVEIRSYHCEVGCCDRGGKFSEALERRKGATEMGTALCTITCEFCSDKLNTEFHQCRFKHADDFEMEEEKKNHGNHDPLVYHVMPYS
jgi:hypothetical protein